MDADQIKAFAAAFDPQPFHLDEGAARQTFFKGLAATGWHTAALTMRLLVESDLKPAGGVIGAGSTNFAGPCRCDLAMSYVWRARSSRCARPDHAWTRD